MAKEGQAFTDILTIFGDKSQASDNLANLKDSIGSALMQGLITGDDIENILGRTKFNIGADLGKGYGLDLGLNVPSPRGGGEKEDYRIKFTKSFQGGGRIKTILEEFKDKSQDADNVKATILDIVRLIDESKQLKDDRDWDFSSFLTSPFAPEEGDIEINEDVENLKDLILAPKSYEEGGEVDLYNQLLGQVAGKADMETSGVENLMAKIAYRESKGVPTQKQISTHPKVSEEGWESLYPEEEGKAYSGPGRGLYQYEIGSMGGSGAGRTAMNRLASVLGKKNLPEWASSYFGKEGSKRDVDFSELTEEQQGILFLADKLQDPMEGNIAAMKDMEAAEWWKKFHHKGKASKKEEEKLIKGFMEDIAFAEKNKGASWNQ